MPLDKRESARLYRLAANQGDTEAESILASRYAVGEGVPQDEREAMRLYRLAADKGHAGAQYNLGACYESGQDVARDEREAARLFRLAAEQGHARVLYNIGQRLMEGSAELPRQLREGSAELPRQLREGALLLARAAQQQEDEEVWQRALTFLGMHVHERDVVHACCIGCGKSRNLRLCGKCRVAKWCGPECSKRMWPAHKACCKEWADAAADEAAAAQS